MLNTYAGVTTISAGTLQIGNGGTTGSIVGNVIDNSNLVFSRTDSIAFSGIVSGTGTLEQVGSGTLRLTGGNTYSGATTVSRGTLQAGSLAGLSSGSAFTVNSVLDLDGFSNTVASLAGNGTVTNSGGTGATMSVGGNNSSTDFSGTLNNGTCSVGLAKR